MTLNSPLPSHGVWRTWLSEQFTLPTLLFAGFLSFPNVLADDTRYGWLPIAPEHLRLFLVISILSWMGVSLIRRGLPQLSSLVSLATLFALFSIPVFSAETSPYAQTKVDKLFSSTLICVFAPLWLIQDRRDLRGLLNAIAGVGLLYVSLGLVGLVRNPEMVGRLSALGSNPITLGKMASTVFLWCTFLAIAGRIRLLPSLIVSLPCFLVMLASGSRGPLVSSLFSVPLALFLFRVERKQIAHRILVICAFAALITGLFAFREHLPRQSIGRIESFFSGQFGKSEKARARAAAASLEGIAESPFGLGWGQFGPYSGIVEVVESSVVANLKIGSQTMSYPHNIFLEVLLEAGWLAGGLLIGLVVLSVFRLWRLGNAVEQYTVLILILGGVVSACISGDINSNRLLLALMSVGMVAERFRSECPRHVSSRSFGPAGRQSSGALA